MRYGLCISRYMHLIEVFIFDIEIVHKTTQGKHLRITMQFYTENVQSFHKIHLHAH